MVAVRPVVRRTPLRVAAHLRTAVVPPAPTTVTTASGAALPTASGLAALGGEPMLCG